MRADRDEEQQRARRRLLSVAGRGTDLVQGEGMDVEVVVVVHGGGGTSKIMVGEVSVVVEGPG